MMDPSMPFGRYLRRVIVMLHIQGSKNCDNNERKGRDVLERSPSNADDLTEDQPMYGSTSK